MTINYDYYRIFYVVAQCRSFTRAAELLKNNQPNITRCMKNLEQELGCKLFHRSNKGITLTPEGQRFYRRVAAAVEQLQLGETVERCVGSLESGSLSISASEAAPAYDPAGQAVHFPGAVPGGCTCASPTRPPPRPSSGCGMGRATLPSSPRRCPPAAPCSRPSCCALPRYRCAARPTATWPPAGCTMAELANCPLVCLGEDTSTYAFYQSFFNSHGQPFRVDVEAATMDQILPMVEHGLGHRFLPQPAGGPPHRPGGAVLHPAGPARPRAGHHPGGGHRPVPAPPP